MSDRLPSFTYFHEIQPDTVSTQAPAYPPTDAGRKMGDRCVPQPGRLWGSLSTTSCFAFTSLAKMNNSLLQWEPIFLPLHSSAVICFQTNTSNHVQLAATEGLVSCSGMVLVGPLWTGSATCNSFLLCPTLMGLLRTPSPRLRTLPLF